MSNALEHPSRIPRTSRGAGPGRGHERLLVRAGRARAEHPGRAAARGRARAHHHRLHCRGAGEARRVVSCLKPLQNREKYRLIRIFRASMAFPCGCVLLGFSCSPVSGLFCFPGILWSVHCFLPVLAYGQTIQTQNNRSPVQSLSSRDSLRAPPVQIGGMIGPYVGGLIGSTGERASYALAADLAAAGSLLAALLSLLLPAHHGAPEAKAKKAAPKYPALQCTEGRLTLYI